MQRRRLLRAALAGSAVLGLPASAAAKLSKSPS